jgi:hypothetical protein
MKAPSTVAQRRWEAEQEERRTQREAEHRRWEVEQEERRTQREAEQRRWEAEQEERRTQREAEQRRWEAEQRRWEAEQEERRTQREAEQRRWEAEQETKQRHWEAEQPERRTQRETKQHRRSAKRSEREAEPGRVLLPSQSRDDTTLLPRQTLSSLQTLAAVARAEAPLSTDSHRGSIRTWSISSGNSSSSDSDANVSQDGDVFTTPPEPAPRTSTAPPKPAPRTSSPVSTSSVSLQEITTYPQGHVTATMPGEYEAFQCVGWVMDRFGKPSGSTSTPGAPFRRRRRCVGVLSCPTPGCLFAARPRVVRGCTKNRELGVFGDRHLCTGVCADAGLSVELVYENCKATLTYTRTEQDGDITIVHHGEHAHRCPPVARLTGAETKAMRRAAADKTLCELPPKKKVRSTFAPARATTRAARIRMSAVYGNGVVVSTDWLACPMPR